MISKERLVKEQRNTGYRQEIIEKVVWLIHVLSAISEDSFLKTRLALKGGTALNLFYFDLPRLSWVNHLTTNVQASFQQLLPFTLQEQQFIRLIQQDLEIRPELITTDPVLSRKIELHPVLLWAARKR